MKGWEVVNGVRFVTVGEDQGEKRMKEIGWKVLCLVIKSCCYLLCINLSLRKDGR